MERLTKLMLGMTILPGALAAAAQTPEPIPQHPISTKPEGVPLSPVPPCEGKVVFGDHGTKTTSSTCPPVDTTPAAPAQKFPFPGEDSAAITPAQTPSAPAANAPAAQKFPFPTEKESAPGLADAGSSGESSSSSSSSSGPDPTAGPLGEDDDPAAKAAAERKAARHKLPKGERLSPSEREDEDLRVAAFYQNDGNFRAAYQRATDAVSIAADDPDAHFALAEAARKLLKLDEAKQHYEQCLKLDPIPKEKKAAEKALKEMAGGTS
jgi:hypothetical protein